MPFLAEAMWQNLAVSGVQGPADLKQAPVESVHLCDYPAGDTTAIDEELSPADGTGAGDRLAWAAARGMGAKLKVRQPLSRVEVVLADATHQAWLEEHAALICDELNVKRVEFTEKADQYITYTVLPDLKRLGPRLGKRLPALRKLLAEADGGRLLGRTGDERPSVTLVLPDGPITLDSEDVQVRLQAKPGWAAAQGHAVVVVLATELTPGADPRRLARETGPRHPRPPQGDWAASSPTESRWT